jgi:ribosomal-protein-alanine N-acetyltransferase
MIQNRQDDAVRRMGHADIDRVLSIEKACFRSPWSRSGFETEIEKKSGFPFVFVDRNRVVGYVIAWKVADEMHIANLAVHPRWRRRGIGETLLEHVLSLTRNCSWIGLEVRRSNAPALRLYRTLGFKEAGIRKGYYADEMEDAVIMVKQPNPVEDIRIER